ncbi:PKD domain-containing protein [Aquimarina sp. 2201CG14-23]|uniref:PKD domain-containing protein n=1 Tax=Aquimarina mycalae TaxID=3040073 RepID=UPI0024781100|nr:PKD domain-containing protein [Aquimarina sp. 2201CG14-23]MDH7444135.1 PKD domain-containing protein [Aquimarina sp. 2201CG14-23]
MATIKLEEITTQYRSFVDDQVLTAEQLNTVIDYFEDQNRLTRICLSGVGIVCGLNITYEENTSIIVSDGCAVTTDGDLIKYLTKTYTHVKSFKDVDASYSKFTGVTDIQELITTEESESTEAFLLNTVTDIADRVVVLYLENYSKEETPCTSADCDTQGEEQVAKIRVLLLSKTDVKIISNKANDPIFDKHNNTKKYINLPEISVKRVILKNEYELGISRNTIISQNSNTADYFKLKNSYLDVIKNTTVTTDLKAGITRLFTDFKTLLDTDSLVVKTSSVINNRIDSIFKISIRNIPLDIQYRYDVLKDLVNTYNEIKCLLFDLKVICCPDKSSFPKHLLLGELTPAGEYLDCRHCFYPSPIITNGKEKWEEIRNLIERIHYMLSEYNITQSAFTDIKVTPSMDYNTSLSKRSIPYYYSTSKNLIENWNYQKTKKYEEDQNLGYRSTNLSGSDPIQNPLDYNIDGNDFYRIEGHLGKDYRTAIKDLDTIKNEKGLAFDIKVLSIDETLESLDLSEYKCQFDDLNAVLKAWRAEQNCLNANVAKFFSGFSVRDKGRHKFYKVDSFETPIVSEAVSEVPFVSERALLSPITSISSLEASIDTVALDASFRDIGGFQTVYNVDTVVADNIIKDEDVLGKVIDKAFREKPEGSAEDIIAVIKKDIDEDPEISTWEDEIKEVAINQPAEILAFTKVATKFIPNSVEEMEIDRIRDYKVTVDNLCERVEAYKKRTTGLLYSETSNYNRAGFEQQYALLLNQLSINCCAAEKIEVLLDEIQKRKEEVLAQKLLSKFVEKHSGLEHKAGVKPGGTFVMVYKGKSKSTSRVPSLSRNPILSTPLTISNTSRINPLEIVNPSISPVAFDPTRVVNPGITAINPSLFNVSNLNFDLFSNAVLRPLDNVTENTVVADFALPYNCCSDCAPVSFIIPKQPVSLRLPVDFVCLDDTTTPIAFEVVPGDAIVAADVEEGLNGGVVQVDGKFLFDATQISEELESKEISFTANDQITEAKIVVYRKPDFDFVNTEPKYFNDDTVASVNFTVQGVDLPAGVKYFWDFGDNTLPDNRTDENPRHEYKLPVNEENLVTVTLTVTNGKCSHSVSHDIQFEVEVVDRECIENAKNTVEKGMEELPQFSDISDNLRQEVLEPTQALYKVVLEQFEEFTNGDFNEELNERFVELIRTTFKNILTLDDQDSFEFFSVTNIFRLQIQLFYSILCCQSNELIEKFGVVIEEVLTEINQSLEQFGENRIEIDKEGRLKEFLQITFDKVEGIELLQRNIKTQLEFLNS